MAFPSAFYLLYIYTSLLVLQVLYHLVASLSIVYMMQVEEIDTETLTTHLIKRTEKASKRIIRRKSASR